MNPHANNVHEGRFKVALNVIVIELYAYAVHAMGYSDANGIDGIS